MFSSETIEEALARCLKEETGHSEFLLERFVGSIISHFERNDGAKIEKTTIYFYGKLGGAGERNPQADEIDDKLILVSPNEAIALLKESNNEEYTIVERS